MSHCSRLFACAHASCSAVMYAVVMNSEKKRVASAADPNMPRLEPSTSNSSGTSEDVTSRAGIPEMYPSTAAAANARRPTGCVVRLDT